MDYDNNNSFKIGDTIICTNIMNPTSPLKIGNSYTVKQVISSKIIELQELTGSWVSSQFINQKDIVEIRDIISKVLHS